jgi:hypothetical protein
MAGSPSAVLSSLPTLLCLLLCIQVSVAQEGHMGLSLS